MDYSPMSHFAVVTPKNIYPLFLDLLLYAMYILEKCLLGLDSFKIHF